MKNKNLIIGISAFIALVVIIGGGYALSHKSKTATTTAPSYSSTQATTQKASSTTSTSKDIIQNETSSSAGTYLATSSGMALYTYSKDTAGVSNCNGSCLRAWPAYAPTSTSDTMPANVSVIIRSDGTKQYAYKGMPLYTFTSDSSGQVTGNGVSGFVVAKP